MMSEEQIFTYLTSAGLAPHQAAGLMGSVAQESGFNPRAVNPKSKAVGLFQHLGPRKAALHDFARKSGRDPLDGFTQIDHAINELNGPEAKARASLMSAPDVDSATLAFSHDFERAGKAERNDARRISKAREILDRMMQKYGMPALNAMIPAAQADEIPPPPPGFDADELPPLEASEIPPPPPGFDADELPPEPAMPVQASPPAGGDVKKGWLAELGARLERSAENTMDNIVESPNGRALYRQGAKAISAPLSFANTLGNLPFNAATFMENRLDGGNRPYAENQVDKAVKALLGRYSIGPDAESKTEKAGGAALAAAVGGNFMRAIPTKFTQWMGSEPARQAGGAALGVTTGDLARDAAKDAGAPEIVQTGAELLGGIAGGMGGAATVGAAQRIGGGMERAGQAVIGNEEGLDKIKGRILKRQHADPEAAIARYENPELNKEIVDGSKPTAVEVSQDPDLIGNIRSYEASEVGKRAGFGSIRDQRISQMDDAVTDMMDKANLMPQAGEVDIVHRLRKVKEDAFNKFAQGKNLRQVQVDWRPLKSAVLDAKAEHGGDSSITKYIDKIAEEVNSGELTFARLWKARREIDNQLYAVWDSTPPESKKMLASVGNQLRTAMNEALVAADPTFKPFLDRYSAAATAESQVKLGRELVRKIQNTVNNTPQGADMVGSRRLSAAKAANLENELYTVVQDELSPLGEKLSERQIKAFAKAIREKDRGNILNKTTGQSQTAPFLAEGKMLAEDIANGVLGLAQDGKGGGLTRSLAEFLGGRPVDFMARQVYPNIGRGLAKAYQDPAEMARLLKLADDFPMITLKGAAKNAAKHGSLGDYYGLRQE